MRRQGRRGSGECITKNHNFLLYGIDFYGISYINFSFSETQKRFIITTLGGGYNIAYPFMLPKSKVFNVLHIPYLIPGNRGEFIRVSVYTASNNKWRYGLPEKRIYDSGFLYCPLIHIGDAPKQIPLVPQLFLKGGRIYWVCINGSAYPPSMRGAVLDEIGPEGISLGIYSNVGIQPKIFNPNHGYRLLSGNFSIVSFRDVKAPKHNIIALDANNNYYGEVTLNNTPKVYKISIPYHGGGLYAIYTDEISSGYSNYIDLWGPGLTLPIVASNLNCPDNNCGLNHNFYHALIKRILLPEQDYYIQGVAVDSRKLKILRLNPFTEITLSGTPPSGSASGNIGNVQNDENYFRFTVPPNNGGLWDIWVHRLTLNSSSIFVYRGNNMIGRGHRCEMPCHNVAFHHTLNHSRITLNLEANTEYIVKVTANNYLDSGGMYNLWVRKAPEPVALNYSNGNVVHNANFNNGQEIHWYTIDVTEEHPHHLWTQLGSVPTTGVVIVDVNSGNVMRGSWICVEPGCNLNHSNNHSRINYYFGKKRYYICVGSENTTGSYTLRMQKLIAQNISMNGNPLYGEANGNIFPNNKNDDFLLVAPKTGFYDIWTQMLTLNSYHNISIRTADQDEVRNFYDNKSFCVLGNLQCNLDHNNNHVRLGDRLGDNIMRVGTFLEKDKLYWLRVTSASTGTYKIKVMLSNREGFV